MRPTQREFDRAIVLGGDLSVGNFTDVYDHESDERIKDLVKVEVLFQVDRATTAALTYSDGRQEFACLMRERKRPQIKHETAVEMLQQFNKLPQTQIMRQAMARTTRWAAPWDAPQSYPLADLIEAKKAMRAVEARATAPRRVLEAACRWEGFLQDRMVAGPEQVIPASLVDEECPDCYGTGYHNGFGGPCLDGCSPPES